MKNKCRMAANIGGVLLIAMLAISAGCAQTKVVAKVNGEEITQEELSDRLMQKAGKQILDEMITEKLILQEAKDKNVDVSEDEINDRIDELKKQFPDEESFNKNLKENNMTLDQVKKQLRVQLITQKILKKDIVVSKDEIKNYFEQNKETIYKDKKFEDVEDQIKEQLGQQKLYQKQQGWIEDLKSKAKIENTLDSKE